ncbi:MAG: anaerobic ribonucleoside-triphosphate reductase [Succinivibrio sp.]
MENYCRLLPNHEGIVGKDVKFERIRRVTGYLVGTLDRFNDAKRAEERDRLKHMHLS